MSTTPEMPSSGLVVVEHSGTVAAAVEHGQPQNMHSNEEYNHVESTAATTTTTTLVTTSGSHYITSSGEIISNGQILKFVSEEGGALLEHQQQHHYHDDSHSQIHTHYHLHQHQQITVNGPKVQLLNNVVQLAKGSGHHQTINFVPHQHQQVGKSGVNSFTYVTNTPCGSSSINNLPAKQMHGTSTWTTANANNTKMIMNGGGITYKTISQPQLIQQQHHQPIMVNHVLKQANMPTGAVGSAKVLTTGHQRPVMTNRQQSANTIHLNTSVTTSSSTAGGQILLTNQPHLQSQQQSSHLRNAGVATTTTMTQILGGGGIQQQPLQHIQKHTSMGTMSASGSKIVRGKAGQVAGTTFKVVTNSTQSGRAIKTIPPHHMVPAKSIAKTTKFSTRQFGAISTAGMSSTTTVIGQVQPRNVHIQQQQQQHNMVNIHHNNVASSAVSVMPTGFSIPAKNHLRNNATTLSTSVQPSPSTNVYIQGAVQRMGKVATTNTKYHIQQQHQQVLVQQQPVHQAYQPTMVQQQLLQQSMTSATTTQLKLSSGSHHQQQQHAQPLNQYHLSASHLSGIGSNSSSSNSSSSSGGTIKYVNAQGNVIPPPSRIRAILQQQLPQHQQQHPHQNTLPIVYGTHEHLAGESISLSSAFASSSSAVTFTASGNSSRTIAENDTDQQLMSDEMSARILQSLSQKSVFNNNNNSNHNNLMRQQQQHQFQISATPASGVSNEMGKPQQIVYVTTNNHQQQTMHGNDSIRQQQQQSYMQQTLSTLSGSPPDADLLDPVADATQSNKHGTEVSRVRSESSATVPFSHQQQPPYESQSIQMIQQHQQSTDDDNIIGEEIRPTPINIHQDKHMQVLHVILQDHSYCIPPNYNVQQQLAAQTKVTTTTISADEDAATVTSEQCSLSQSIVGAIQHPQQSQLQVMTSTKDTYVPPVGPHRQAPASTSSSKSVNAAPSSAFLNANGIETAITDLNDDPNDPDTVDHSIAGLIITKNVTTIALSPTPIGLPGEETDTAPENEGYEDSVTRCICDLTHDDGYMICCDKCSAWQHVDCMGIDRTNIPDEYNCVVCQPRPVDRLRARSLQLLKRKEQQHFALLNNPNGLTPAQLAANTPLPIDGLPAHIALTQHQQSVDGAEPAVLADSTTVLTAVSNVAGSTETAIAAIDLKPNSISNHSVSTAAIPSSTASNKTCKSKSSGTKQRKPNSATETASIVTASATTNTHNSVNAGTNNATKSARKRNDSATRVSSTSVANGKRRESAKKSSSSTVKRRSGKHTPSGSSGSMTNATAAHDSDIGHLDNKPTPAALKQWIENYEQAMTNHYSPELRARLQAIHKQQAAMPPLPLHPHLRNLHHLEAGKCTTVPHAGGKILISMLDLPPQRPIIEVHGKFMLSAQYKPTPGVSAGRLPGPFLFFYRLPPNESGISPTPTSSPSAPITEVCVDTRTFGNDARFVRRSCRPNAEILHTVEKNAIHLYIVSLTQVKASTEITVRHEPHDLEALAEQKLSQPTSTICACGLTKECAFTMTGTAAPLAEESMTLTPTTLSTKSATNAAKSKMSPVTTSGTLTTQLLESPKKPNLAPILMQSMSPLLQPTPYATSPQQHQHLTPHRLNGYANVSSTAASSTMLMLTGEDRGLAVTPVPTNATTALSNANTHNSAKPWPKRTTVSAQTARHRSISNSSSCSSEIAAASGMMSPSHQTHQQQHLTYPNPHPFTAPHLLHGDAFGGSVGGGASSSSSSGAYATSSIGSPPMSMASPSLPSPVMTNNKLTSPPHVAYHQSTILQNHAQQHVHHNQQQQPYPALTVTPTQHFDDQSSLPPSSASSKLSHPFLHNHHHQHSNHNNQQQIQSTLHAITQQANDLPPATIHLVPAIPKTATPLFAASVVSGSSSGFLSTMLPSSNTIGQLSISTSMTTAPSGASSSPVLPPATLSLVVPPSQQQHQNIFQLEQPMANHLSALPVSSTASSDIDTCDGPATLGLTSTASTASSIQLQAVPSAAALRPASLVLNELCTTETLAESPNPMQMAAGCAALDTPLTPLRSPTRHQQQQCFLVVDTTAPHKTVAMSPRKKYAAVADSNQHITATPCSLESTLTPETSNNDFIPETSATQITTMPDTSTTTTAPTDTSPTTSTTTPVAMNSIKESKKLTREERKMQAIMRAFEKMEKNQQRKQELNKSKSSTPTTPLVLLGSSTGGSITVASNVCAAPEGQANVNDTPLFGSPAKRASTVGDSSGGNINSSSNSQRKKKRKSSKSYQQSTNQRKRVRNRLHSGGDSDGGGRVGALDSLTLHRSPSGALTRPLSTTTSSNNNHVHSLHGSHPYAAEYGDDADADNDAADAGDDHDEHQYPENNRINVPVAAADNTGVDTVAAAGMLMSLAAHCSVASPTEDTADTIETPAISTPAKIGSSNALSLSSACLLIEAAVGPFDPSQQQPLQREFKLPPKTKTKKTIMNEWLHQTVGNNDALSSSPIMQLQPNFDEQPVHLASSLSTTSSGQSLVAYGQTDIIQPEAPQNLSIAAQRIEEFINISSGHSSPLLHESKWPIMQTPANLLHVGEYTNSTASATALTIAVPPAAPTPPMQCGSSVKKRWLRQAISEECSDELSGIAGGTGSPPNGYMTPLKKRRMARECSAAAASAALTDSCPVGQQATPRYDQLQDVDTNMTSKSNSHPSTSSPLDQHDEATKTAQHTELVEQAICDELKPKVEYKSIADVKSQLLTPIAVMDPNHPVPDSLLEHDVKMLESSSECSVTLKTELRTNADIVKEEKASMKDNIMGNHVESAKIEPVVLKDKSMSETAEKTSDVIKTETNHSDVASVQIGDTIQSNDDKTVNNISSSKCFVKLEDVTQMAHNSSQSAQPHLSPPSVIPTYLATSSSTMPVRPACIADEFDIKPLEECDVIELVVPPTVRTVTIDATAASSANVKPSELADIKQRLHSFHNANLMMLQTRNAAAVCKKHSNHSSRSTTPTRDEADDDVHAVTVKDVLIGDATTSSTQTSSTTNVGESLQVKPKPSKQAKMQQLQKSLKASPPWSSNSPSTSSRKRQIDSTTKHCSSSSGVDPKTKPLLPLVVTDAFDIKPLSSVGIITPPPIDANDVLPAFLSSIASPTSVATVHFNLTQPPPPPPPLPPLPPTDIIHSLSASDSSMVSTVAPLVASLTSLQPPLPPPLPMTEPPATSFYQQPQQSDQHQLHLHSHQPRPPLPTQNPTTYPDIVSQLPVSVVTGTKSLLSEYLENPNKPHPTAASSVLASSAVHDHGHKSYASLLDAATSSHQIAAIPTPAAAIAPITVEATCSNANFAAATLVANATAASILMPSPTCTKPVVSRTQQCNDPRLNPTLAHLSAPPTPKRKLSINEYRKRKLQSTSTTPPTTPTTTTSTVVESIKRPHLLELSGLKPAIMRSSLLDGPALPLPLSGDICVDIDSTAQSRLQASSTSMRIEHDDDSNRLNGICAELDHQRQHNSHHGPSVFSAAPTLREQQQENLSHRLKTYKSLSVSGMMVSSSDVLVTSDTSSDKYIQPNNQHQHVGIVNTSLSNELKLLSSKHSSSSSSPTSISSASTTPERASTPTTSASATTSSSSNGTTIISSTDSVNTFGDNNVLHSA